MRGWFSFVLGKKGSRDEAFPRGRGSGEAAPLLTERSGGKKGLPSYLPIALLVWGYKRLQKKKKKDHTIKRKACLKYHVLHIVRLQQSVRVNPFKKGAVAV